MKDPNSIMPTNEYILRKPEKLHTNDLPIIIRV